MMGVFAEFGRAMIRERVNAALARAKAEGKTCIDCHQGIAHNLPEEPAEPAAEPAGETAPAPAPAT